MRAKLSLLIHCTQHRVAPTPALALTAALILGRVGCSPHDLPEQRGSHGNCEQMLFCFREAGQQLLLQFHQNFQVTHALTHQFSPNRLVVGAQIFDFQFLLQIALGTIPTICQYLLPVYWSSPGHTMPWLRLLVLWLWLPPVDAVA